MPLKKKKEAYEQALEYQSIHLDAMEGLINCYKADSNLSSTDYLNLCKRIISTYTYYPQAMVELLGLVSGQVTDSAEVVQLDVLKTNALLKASKATAKQTSNVSACKEWANKYLGNENTDLASVSFDGEHAGSIVLNPKYDESEIRVRYSLDGGNSWTETNNHVITLTEQERSRITAENDIQVGLIGTDEVFVIDIKQGETVLASKIYNNDYENLLIGAIDNLQFSLDDGATWCDYVGGLENGIRIEGHQVVKVRYKAHSVYLQGPEEQFTFKEDTDTETRKYVQLKHVTMEAYSTQQSTNKDHAAVNFIDGNYNTAWHTKYGVTDPDKFYTVSFDKVRYITSLEYTPGGSSNGRLKSADVYTSLDGNTWTKSGSVTNLQNNANVKIINLDAPTACKYVKLVATETHGNSSGETNMYFSGRMLNFFEDATKVYVAQPTIEYSTTEPTNQDVTAKLLLPDGCTIVGDNTHVFKDNGTYTFKYIDVNGAEQLVEAKVSCIDRVAPTVEIEYSTTSPTNQDVVASIKSTSEDVTFISKESYTFQSNGEYTFEFKDKAGNVGTAKAVVTWIDKEAPKADVVYSTKELTKDCVTVTLDNFSEEVEIVNNDGKATYVFEENGTFEFIIRDKAGNETKIPVAVNNIYTGTPNVSVSYSVETLTNKDVVVTIEGLKEHEYVVNNDGKNSYVFKENGTFEFIIGDKVGNEVKVPVAVHWIDKKVPTATVQYDITNWTNQKVTASLTNISEEVTFISQESYVFEDNGEYTFEFVDKAGNKGTATATVNWIDKTKEEEEVIFSEEKETSKPVTVSLNIDLSKVEILNNNGSAEYTFVSNGRFVFRLRLIDTGYEFDYPVEVSWIKEGEPPVINGGNESTGTQNTDKGSESTGIPNTDKGSESTKKPNTNSGTISTNKPQSSTGNVPSTDYVANNNSSTNSNSSGSSTNTGNISTNNNASVNGNTLLHVTLQETTKNSNETTNNRNGETETSKEEYILEEIAEKDNEKSVETTEKSEESTNSTEDKTTEVANNNAEEEKNHSNNIIVPVSITACGIGLVGLIVWIKRLLSK